MFQSLPSFYHMTLAITQWLRTRFSVQQQIYGWFSSSLTTVNYHLLNNFLESITVDFCNRLYCYPNFIDREMAWWSTVIINLTEFTMTMESHLWVYLWGCFPKRLAEQRGINLDAGWTNLWVVVLDWIRKGRWAAGRQYMISCLTLCIILALWLNLQIVRQINPSPFIVSVFCFVTALRKVTKIFQGLHIIWPTQF